MDHYLRGKIGDLEIKISALCAMTYIYICRYAFLVFARKFSISQIVAGACICGFAVFFTLFTLADRKNICWDGILVVILVAAFFGITIMVHPEYSKRFLDELHNGRHSAKAVFTYGSPIYCYYLFRLFKNEKEKLYSLFKVVGFSIVAFSIWAMYDRSEDYSMGFGYQMELAAIIFVAVYLYEKKTAYLIFSLAVMALGVLYGSRACIVGYAVFIALYFLWDGSFDRRKGVLVAIGLVAAFIYKSQPIIKMLYDLFASMGLKSRTLYFIAEGDILATDTARQDWIWPTLTGTLKEMSPFKMYGAFGERPLLDDKWVYAHNIFLEVFISFGFILGSAFFIWVFVQLVQVIRKNKDLDGLFAILLGSFALCRMLFSSSIWEEQLFWAFIAMLINCAQNRREQRYDDDN